jgi:predicted AAA+ superfamily ATPase
LERELEEQIKSFSKPPIIFIDEVQKIPRMMDIAQHLIDSKSAQFILTGSSARKLKRCNKSFIKTANRKKSIG